MSFPDELAEQPWNYDLLDVLRRFERENAGKPRIGRSATRDEEIVFLGQDAYVEFPDSNIARFSKSGDGRGKLYSRFLGLLGPQGALPLQTTIEARQYVEGGDEALPQFLDLINHRFIQLFFRAWSDARPAGQHDRPDDDHFADYVGSAIGIGTDAFHHRDHNSDQLKLALAGLLGPAVKSVSRIEGMVAYAFGVEASVVPLVGAWLKLPDGDRSSLGGLNASLGRDIIIGAAAYSVQDKFRIRVKVGSLEEFQEFLPDGRHFDRLADLVYFYLGDLLEYEVQLLIPANRTRPASLGQFGRLGWTSWMSRDELADDEELRGECSYHPAERVRQRRAADPNT